VLPTFPAVPTAAATTAVTATGLAAVAAEARMGWPGRIPVKPEKARWGDAASIAQNTIQRRPE
jgi:hypothetical protein